MACRPKNKVCFKCGDWFHEDDAMYCNDCTELKCSKCGACGCNITEGELRVVRAMTKTYETWLEKHLEKQDLYFQLNSSKLVSTRK